MNNKYFESIGAICWAYLAFFFFTLLHWLLFNNAFWFISIFFSSIKFRLPFDFGVLHKLAFLFVFVASTDFISFFFFFWLVVWWRRNYITVGGGLPFLLGGFFIWWRDKIALIRRHYLATKEKKIIVIVNCFHQFTLSVIWVLNLPFYLLLRYCWQPRGEKNAQGCQSHKTMKNFARDLNYGYNPIEWKNMSHVTPFYCLYNEESELSLLLITRTFIQDFFTTYLKWKFDRMFEFFILRVSRSRVIGKSLEIIFLTRKSSDYIFQFLSINQTFQTNDLCKSIWQRQTKKTLGE